MSIGTTETKEITTWNAHKDRELLRISAVSTGLPQREAENYEPSVARSPIARRMAARSLAIGFGLQCPAPGPAGRKSPYQESPLWVSSTETRPLRLPIVRWKAGHADDRMA